MDLRGPLRGGPVRVVMSSITWSTARVAEHRLAMRIGGALWLREIVVLSDASGSHYLRVTVTATSEAEQAIPREFDGVPVIVVQKP